MSAPARSLSARSRGLPGRPPGPDKPRPVRCQICHAVTQPGLDLGVQPVSDLVVAPSQLNRPETFYPLQLHHCLECGLTQLGYTVNPRVVYRHFPFVSGTTQTATRHLQGLAQDLVERLGMDRHSFAVDVGSNDGTLLKGYLASGVRFLGVDPAGDPVRVANAAGIPTLHAFFNEETADAILDSHGQAHAISAAGVFAHIADLAGVMKGVKRLLAPKGIFATDSQYWLDMVRRLHYDNIFHQHLRYYSLKPLIRMFDGYEMDVFDVERSEVYGGSIRVFSGHRGDHPISPRVPALLAAEEQAGLYRETTFERFTRKIAERRQRLFDAVYRLASTGKTVIGVGAPAKASTVCNYCRLGPDLVSYITEVNPLRIGTYLPGVRIPIVDEARMLGEQRRVDAAILFAWNYSGEILRKLRRQGLRCKILLP